MSDSVIMIEFHEIAGGLVNTSVTPWPQMEKDEIVERLRWVADVMERNQKLVRVK